MKKIFDKNFIGLFIGFIFLVLIIKNIDLNKSLEEIKNFNPSCLVLMIPAYYCSFFFRALRWRIILSGNKSVKIIPLFNYLLRGWTVNSLVPARAGEFYRAHITGKRECIGRMTVLASIVLERIFDGLFLFATLLSLVCLIYSNEKFLGASITAGIIFIGGFTGLLLVSKFYNNPYICEKCHSLKTKLQEKNFAGKVINEKLCAVLDKIFDKLTYLSTSFMEGLDIFNSFTLVLKAFLYTIPVWLCEGLTILFLIKGFGHSIGVWEALFVICIIAFASLIPGGPGGIGPMQWGAIVGLGFFNISSESAFAISVINQLFIIILVSSGSLFFIILEHFNIFNKDLPECSEEVKEV